MAVLNPRVVLVCTVPVVVTLLTILWTKRRRRAVPFISTSTRSVSPVPAQEEQICEVTDFCDSSESNTLLEGAGCSASFQEEQASSNPNAKVYDRANQSAYTIEEPFVREDTVAVDTELYKERIPECAQNEKACLVKEQSLPDVQVVRTEVSKEQSKPGGVEELQEALPIMHVRSIEECQAAKLEQDCSLSLDDSCASELCEKECPVNNDESFCGDKDSPQDSNLSEESRDSAMGGEEEDAVLEQSSVCSLLESIPMVPYDSSRTDFEDELLSSEALLDQNGESECFNDLDEVLGSPPHSIYSDEHSEGSCDSGKGGSDIHIISSSEVSKIGESALLAYEFEIPQDLCGLLIGRSGKHVNSIKSSSNASVFIKRHPFNSKLKLCSLQGTKLEIQSALEMIRKRFPVSQYPAVSLAQVNIPLGCGVIVPETLQLRLPEGVMCDVILSSLVSAGHFFIQQPTHPTYPSLGRLDMCMTSCYTQMDTPQIPHPVEVGVICACPVLEGWFRAQVVSLKEDSEDCEVKFVDYGGYSLVPLSKLRQIRSDFMTLPFQASECYLANVTPPSESWSLEACATFEELAQGQILQALMVGHAEDGIPYIHLYRVQGVSTVFINRELVNRGVAQWLETEA